MLKRCKEHGNSKVLIADDIEYYKNIRNYNKPSETPYVFNTKPIMVARTIVGCAQTMSSTVA
ncbi:molybdenum cofactor biosynthesis protein MoaA [Algibacter lectus]|uniref:Molybdenum cofactor biosynthesis protein MoaA n=1 Tax=Algibacter lectus TaxID=221126 RepID=A0A090WNH4_9FLAO|nr:molybdenum cofactor biosynthesis protein MoaA [Algibacter lectus]